MPRTRLELSHREVIQKILTDMKVSFSEYSFTNLYLFRGIHAYYISDIDGYTFIEGVTRDGHEYSMPLFATDASSIALLEKLLDEGRMLFPVDETLAAHFREKGYGVEYKEADSDYIFTTNKLATYPGRYLHKKRNLMKQFMEQYSWYTNPINAENIHEAVTVLEQWQKDTGLSSEETDYLSCKEALVHYEELGLSGTLFYAEGTIAGFLLGDKISQDTYALHFAKGLTRFKGIYQFMYNVFAKELDGDCSFINFEQDLGIPALKQAKESYQPDLMAHKYRIQKLNT
jgi:uncharacterized protein